MKRSKLKLRSSISLLPLFAVALPSMAIAQDDTIVVTAQKREQDLQDVPISVQAVTGEVVTENVIILLDQLDEVVPNLAITEGLTGNTLNIRGIGTSQGSAGFEQSVATFADGVYVGRSRQSRSALMDVQQVEVLRGPQPVYFGQSAVAGALNITTRDGSGPFRANLTASYGNDSEFVIEGGATLPLIEDKLGVRLAGRYSEYDGYQEDVTGELDTAREAWVYRGTVNFQATEWFDVEFKAEVGRTEQNGVASDVVNCDPTNPIPVGAPPIGTICGNISAGGAWAPFLPADIGNSVADLGVVATGGSVALIDANGPAPGGLSAVPNSAPEFFTRPAVTETQLFAGTWNVDLGPATLTGIHSYSEYDYDARFDLDASPFALLSPWLQEEFEASSHEIRITSNEPAGDFLDYMVGYYRQSHELDTLNRTANAISFLLPTPPFARNSTGTNFSEESTWNTVFAAFTGHLNDRTRLNFGVRYSDVQKDGFSFFLTTPTNFAGLGEFANFAQSPNYMGTPFAAQIAGLTITGTDSAADCPGGFQNAPTGNGGSLQTHCVVGEVDTDDFSFQVSGEYDLADDVMAYASYTTGFKAGGFAQSGQGVARSTDAFVFDDEDVKSYEIGINSRFMDKRVRLNAAAFYMDFSNLQVSSFDVNTNSFNILNAAEAETYGIELDGDFSVSDEFTILFSGAWIETEIGDYPGAQCSQFEQGNNLNGCTFGAAGGGMGPPVSTTNRAGQELLFAPSFQLNIGARYDAPIDDNLRAGLSGNVFYQDDYIVSDRYDPRVNEGDGVGGVQSGFARLNLRAEIGSQDGRWTLAGYANNLTDEQPLITFGPSQFNGIDSGFALRERGRSYGVQLRLNTGG